MRVADALARLDQHQTDILATIAGALKLAEGEPAVVRMALARARWKLARQLREYQVFKHNEIFGPATLSGTPLHAERARAMAQHCTDNGEQFQDYLKRWSSRDVVQQWEEYKPAMLAMTSQLRRMLAVERGNVVALLAGSARTRQLHA